MLKLFLGLLSLLTQLLGAVTLGFNVLKDVVTVVGGEDPLEETTCGFGFATDEIAEGLAGKLVFLFKLFDLLLGSLSLRGCD